MHMNRTIIAAALALIITIPAVTQNRDAEIRIAISDSELQLNPLHAYVVTEAQLLTGLHEGLVSYHPLTLDPVPGVAESWSISDDGTVYEFHLRSDARFSNGDPVTAEHVRDTWLALLDLGDDAPYAGLFDIVDGARAYRRGESEDRDDVGIRAPSDDRLEVELTQPAGHFLQMIAHHSFGILHPDMIEREDHNEPENHIGNGPFVLAEVNAERIVMERNERYWGERSVESERIIFVRTDDSVGATDDYFDGEIDWVLGPIDFDAIVDDRDLVVNALFATTFYYLRAEVEPWDDPDIRRALALLIPWDEVRSDEVYFLPTHRLVPDLPGYPEIVGLTERDEEEALSLLEGAGYPAGEGLPDVLIRIPGGFDANRVAELMADAWESVLDISVEIETVPYPDYFDAAGESEVTVGMFSWIGDYSDPLTFLQLWTSDSNLNEVGLTDERYDALVDRSIPLEDSERFEVMAEAEEMLLQSGTIMPVTHTASFNLIDLNTIEGWFPNALDIHPLRYLRKRPQEPAPDLIRFSPGL